MNERVLRDGASWVGRRELGDSSFRCHFGVYPRTAQFVAVQLGYDRELLWFLKTLWWLKEYPTDEHIKDKRVSPTNFRSHLWPTLSDLEHELPEVVLSSCPLQVCSTTHSCHLT
jgi:hypothetical protein